jgi:hypothetical protein
MSATLILHKKMILQMVSTARTRHKGRRPIWEPTEEERKFVSSLTAYGITQNEICFILDITVPTLHKHFRKEIDTALPLANAKVAEGLFNNATKLNNVTAQIFWLKTRAKWIEARPEENPDKSLNIRITGGLPDE